MTQIKSKWDRESSLTNLIVLKSLNFKLDNNSDDIYSYLELCLLYVKTLLPQDDNCTFNWLSGYCVQILEMIYFQYELLQSMSMQEMACAGKIA